MVHIINYTHLHEHAHLIHAHVYYTYVLYAGKKMSTTVTIQLNKGKTSPLSAFSISFLGCTFTISPSETKSASSAKLLKRFSTCLQKIDQRPIRGEFKVWIYRFYLVQSIRFCLAVDLISATVLQKIHSLATKLLKKWLSLPRNATQAILYHPSGLNCPSIPTIKTRAKISFLASIITSPDHLLHELQFLINDTNSSKQVGFPQESFSILQAAKKQIQNLPTAKKLAKVGRSLAKERERKT